MFGRINAARLSPLFSLYACAITLQWVLLQSYRQLGAPRLTTDFISWALTSMAPFFGIGKPYVDYWGINPPGVLMMTGGWGYLIGDSLRSFHVLYLACLAMTMWLVWRVLGATVTIFERPILFTLFGLFFFHSSVQSQFFPSEINGIVFATAGLWLICRTRPSPKQIFWAHFLFILAGQMKEVFALQGLALLPHVLVAWNQGWQQTRRYLMSAVGGVGLATLMIVGYLVANSSLAEYQAITAYKSSAFSVMDGEKIGSRIYRSIQYPRDRFFYARYQVPVILLVGVLSALLLMSSIITTSPTTPRSSQHVVTLSLSVPPRIVVYAVIICYWFGATLGYTMQGRYGNKYDIVPILPLLLILSLTMRVLTRSLWQLTKWPITPGVRAGLIISSVLATGVLTMPQKTFLTEPLFALRDHSVQNHVVLWQRAEAAELLALEQKIAAHTSANDCITSVYGWGVGDTYYYSKRPSCSKYFLVNILPRERSAEYTQHLIANPPKAIVYTHAGADLDTGAFEREVFNFPLVIEHCYQQDETFSTLYWRQSSPNEAASCINRYYRNSTI